VLLVLLPTSSSKKKKGKIFIAFLSILCMNKNKLIVVWGGTSEYFSSEATQLISIKFFGNSKVEFVGRSYFHQCQSITKSASYGSETQLHPRLKKISL
jgi:hypothetical protein